MQAHAAAMVPRLPAAVTRIGRNRPRALLRRGGGAEAVTGPPIDDGVNHPVDGSRPGVSQTREDVPSGGAGRGAKARGDLGEARGDLEELLKRKSTDPCRVLL